MPGVARLLRADAGQEQREVVLAEAQDVGDGAPVGEPFTVCGGRYEQGADVGVDGHGDVLACLGEVVLDAAAAGLLYQCQGAGVQAGRLVLLGGGEFVGGPLPVGGSVGVEGVGGLAGLVEVGDGERAGLGGGGHAAGQVDAGGSEAGVEEGAEDVVGEPPEETRPGTEPGEGDGGVGGAATGQGPQREYIGVGSGGVGEGVGDALTEDGDADGGLGSGHGDCLPLSGRARVEMGTGPVA